MRSPFRKVIVVVVVFSTPLQSLLQQRFHITCLGEIEPVGLPQMATPQSVCLYSLASITTAGQHDHFPYFDC